MSDNGDNGNATPPHTRPEKLEIRVRDQNNQEVTFQVKPITKFQKIMGTSYVLEADISQ